MDTRNQGGKEMTKTVTINVDPKLLRKQVRYLDKIAHSAVARSNDKQTEYLDGLWETCRAILDKCENKKHTDVIVESDAIVAWGKNREPLFAVVPIEITIDEADAIAHKVKSKYKFDNTSEEDFVVKWEG